jgi:hypothetical protein
MISNPDPFRGELEFRRAEDSALPRLFLVLVNVHYTKGQASTNRQWPVRIVAMTSEAAQLGAMNWAERQEAPGIVDASQFANSATTIDVIATVDCIGETLLREPVAANDFSRPGFEKLPSAATPVRHETNER